MYFFRFNPENPARVERSAEVAWYCVNVACPAQLIRNVEHFASRGSMDIVGLGYKILDDEYNEMQFGFDATRLLVKRYEDGTSDPVWKAMFPAWGDSASTKRVIWSTGVEYQYGSPRLISLRAGYFHESQGFGGRQYLTFGAGIRYDIYGFDFSYISPTGWGGSDHPLADTIRFSLLIAWGGVN